MACNEENFQEFSESNYIVETVRQIDKIQKEIVIDSATSCITCETSLITRAYNTVPVSFYTCNSVFSSLLESSSTDTTNLFRIECLRDNRFVTLRLLTSSETGIVATTQTCILDLNCCCGIECFEPINVSEC